MINLNKMSESYTYLRQEFNKGWTNCPRDLLELVFKYLNRNELDSVSLVNKRWRRISFGPEIKTPDFQLWTKLRRNPMYSVVNRFIYQLGDQTIEPLRLVKIKNECAYVYYKNGVLLSWDIAKVNQIGSINIGHCQWIKMTGSNIIVCQYDGKIKVLNAQSYKLISRFDCRFVTDPANSDSILLRKNLAIIRREKLPTIDVKKFLNLVIINWQRPYDYLCFKLAEDTWTFAKGFGIVGSWCYVAIEEKNGPNTKTLLVNTSTGIIHEKLPKHYYAHCKIEEELFLFNEKEIYKISTKESWEFFLPKAQLPHYDKISNSFFWLTKSNELFPDLVVINKFKKSGFILKVLHFQQNPVRFSFEKVEMYGNWILWQQLHDLQKSKKENQLGHIQGDKIITKIIPNPPDNGNQTFYKTECINEQNSSLSVLYKGRYFSFPKGNMFQVIDMNCEPPKEEKSGNCLIQ